MASSTELDRPLPPGGLTSVATAPAHDEELNLEYANENPNLTPEDVQLQQQQQQQQQQGGGSAGTATATTQRPPSVPKDIWFKQQQREQSYDSSVVVSQEDVLFKMIQYQTNDISKKWAAQQVGWSPDGMPGMAHPACGWAHIACDPYTNEITKINLSNQHLPIQLIPELQQLKSLTELNVDTNALSGYIPPFLFEAFPNLEYLVLSNNNIVGTIPPVTESLLNLRVFDVTSNRLTGTLPVDFGDVTSMNLEKLDISHNALKGTIPSSITHCKNLGFLDLSSNNLGGSIPKEIGELKMLKGLFLNNNNLMGTIPYTLARADLPLIQVFLEHNQLSGTIPAGLSDLIHLRDLFVDGNKLTGTVPQDLCAKTPTLNNDFFTGKYATPNRDGCTSVACPAGTVSAEGVAPCFACETSDGQLNGQYKYLGVESMKCQYWNQRDILLEFYDEANGLKWTNDEGWAIQGVNECSWKGITCTPQGHVVNITLENLNLSGKIATQLGLLEHLKVLNLANNNLSGNLPSDLRFAPLEVLDVKNNRLEGFVPPMLCLSGSVNGNGIDGQYNCDSIACPAGYYGQETGRMMFETDPTTGQYITPLKPMTQCIPCLDVDATYMGRTFCNKPVAFSTSLGSVSTTQAAIGGVLLTLLLACGACGTLWYTDKLHFFQRDGSSSRSFGGVSKRRRSEEEKQALQMEATSGGKQIGGDDDDDIVYDFEKKERDDVMLSKKQQEEYWMTAAGIDVDAPSMEATTNTPESQHPMPESQIKNGNGNGSPSSGSYDASQANRAVPMPVSGTSTTTAAASRRNTGAAAVGSTSPTSTSVRQRASAPGGGVPPEQESSGTTNEQDNELWLDVPKIV